MSCSCRKHDTCEQSATKTQCIGATIADFLCHMIGLFNVQTLMNVDMTFALACGVFSSSISDGINRASWLKELTIAMLLGARENFCGENEV